MKKKALKSTLIITLLTMLGFVSSCDPDSGKDMYGAPPTEYQKKDKVQEQKTTSQKQDVSPENSDFVDSLKVK